MLPDRVSNPGPLTYESGALPIALRGPAQQSKYKYMYITDNYGIFQPHSSYSMIKTNDIIVKCDTILLNLAIVPFELT